MKPKISQYKYSLKVILAILVLLIVLLLLFGNTNQALAAVQVDPNAGQAPTTNTNPLGGKDVETTDLNAFNDAANDISTTQARLGNELSILPGPNITFNDLLRLVITWSASLAASVAIFLFVLRSFTAISGTEESHNALRTTIIKIIIGLALIFFSYQIVSFIMGIIWAH